MGLTEPMANEATVGLKQRQQDLSKIPMALFFCHAPLFLSYSSAAERALLFLRVIPPVGLLTFF